MNTYVQNNWETMHKDEPMKKLFRSLLIFMRDKLTTIDDSLIRDIFHSLSTTFMPQTLFYLVSNANIMDLGTEETLTN